MEEAAAVSSERLQEVFDRLSDSLSVPAVTSVPVVTQNGSNWRARVKVGRATVNGPTRQAKAAAEEDARLLQQAQQISSAELQKVADRLQKEAADVRSVATVTKHGAGWRARVQGAHPVYGPTTWRCIAVSWFLFVLLLVLWGAVVAVVVVVAVAFDVVVDVDVDVDAFACL
jgi:hypothetical protein